MQNDFGGWVNLTPHLIRVIDPDGGPTVEIPPSGMVARVATTTTRVGRVNGLVIYTSVTGEVTGLPTGEGRFVVSLAVRAARPMDTRLFSPGELRRGPDGQPVGCVGLVGNGGVA